MFTDHGTFIIGFSVSKKHLAVAPEKVTIAHVEDDIVKAGYDYTEQLIRIPWNGPVDYTLLEKMIEFNILDKADCSTFGGNEEKGITYELYKICYAFSFVYFSF